MTRHRSAGHYPGGDEGTTLVELLVVMVLTTVVLAAVGTVFVSTTRGVRETQVRTSSQADARAAMEAMSRSLRVAVSPPRGAPTGPSSTGAAVPGPFTSAGPASVTFYANLQRAAVTFSTSGPTSAPVVRASLQAPWLIAFGYDSTRSCVTETRTPAVVNTAANASTAPYVWPSTSSTTKCLASTTTPPAFTYFTSGVIASGGATPSPIAVDPVTSVLTPAQAGSVVSVGIGLVVTAPNAVDVPPTTTKDRVTLVNVLASQAG